MNQIDELLFLVSAANIIIIFKTRRLNPKSMTVKVVLFELDTRAFTKITFTQLPDRGGFGLLTARKFENLNQ